MRWPDVAAAKKTPAKAPAKKPAAPKPQTAPEKEPDVAAPPADTPATHTPESDQLEAGGGSAPPPAEKTAGDTAIPEGAPTGVGEEAEKSAEPPAPEPPVVAAALDAGDTSGPQGDPPPPETSAETSGKAPEAGAAPASAPPSRGNEEPEESVHEFEALGAIELDRRRTEPGHKIKLTRALHAELRAAGAVAGDWPAD